MKATISSPPGLAYGADDVVPDMPEGLSVEDAIYHTVHGYPGGVAALAARMGVSANTLTHKANPNNSTHHLHPRELVAMQYLSGNAAVLQSMAHSLRYTCTPIASDQTGGDPVEAFMHMQMALAEFVRAVADPLQDRRPGQVTRNEMRRAEECAAELQGAVGYMLASLRAHTRPAPKEQG